MNRALVAVGAGGTLLTSGYRNYIRPYLQGVKAAKKTKELFDAVQKKRSYDSSDSDREVEAVPLQPSFQPRAVVNTTTNESPIQYQGDSSKYQRRKMYSSRRKYSTYSYRRTKRYRPYRRSFGTRRAYRRGGYSLTRNSTFSPELKYYDDINGFKPYISTRAAPSSKCINVIPVGTGVSQRIGNRIVIKSILVRLQLEGKRDTGNTYQYAVANQPSLIRVMIINYKANNYVDRTSSNAVIGQVLQYNTGTNPILSPVEMLRSTDFDILMDKVYAIGGRTYAYDVDGVGNYTLAGGTTVGPLQIWDERFIKCNIKVKYDSSGTSPSNIDKSAIYCFAMSSIDNINTSATADALLPDCNIQTRIRYYDL